MIAVRGDTVTNAKTYRIKRRIERPALDQTPLPESAWVDLAGRRHRQALGLWQQGQAADAKPVFREAVTILEGLVADNPASAGTRQALALSYQGLGIVLADLGDWTEAEAVCQRGLALRAQLAGRFPEPDGYRAELAAGYVQFGTRLLGRERPAAALGWFDRAVPLLEAAQDRAADASEELAVLRSAYQGRGLALGNLGRHAEAVVAWDRAIELDDGSNGLFYHQERAFNAARCRDGAEQQAAVSGRVWCNAAVAYALACAAEAGADRKDYYSDRATAMLRRAWAAGYFRPGAAVRALVADPNLTPVRAGPAFRQLLADAGS